MFLQSFGSVIIAFFVYLITDSLANSLIIVAILFLLIMMQPAILILNKLTQRTNWYKTRIGDGTKFRKPIERNIDICNLGSNSGKFAFDYINTGLKGENWALGPQTLSYDFRILKNYFSYLKKGATVLIPLCPFSGCIIDFEDDKVNHKYYSFLHPILIKNYSEQTKKKVMRFVNHPFLMSPFRSMLRILKDIPARDNRIIEVANIEKDVNILLNNWKRQFSITDLDAPVSKKNRENITYNQKLLAEIFSFCFERELKPVIIIPPVTSALSCRLSETFRENYIYTLFNSSETEQLVFLNYLDDKRFVDPNLFFNSYYLNTKGGNIFTNHVIKDLGLI